MTEKVPLLPDIRLPVDGMNEHGLVVNLLVNRMMEYEDNNPEKVDLPVLTNVEVIRSILSKCRTVDEAKT